MKILWRDGPKNVRQVKDSLAAGGGEEPAYTTVMTVMKKLSEKGFLRFDRDGASYVYSAARSPDDVREGLLRALLEKVFQGSSAALVQTLVRREDISPEEHEEIRRLVENMVTEETHDDH